VHRAELQGGQEFTLREAQEALLIRSDLVQVDAVVSGVEVFADPGEMPFRVRTACEGVGDLILGDR